MKRQALASTTGLCQGCGASVTSSAGYYYDGGWWHADCCPVKNPHTVRIEGGNGSEVTISDWVSELPSGRRTLTGLIVTIREPSGNLTHISMSPEMAHTLGQVLHTRVRAKSSQFYK